MKIVVFDLFGDGEVLRLFEDKDGLADVLSGFENKLVSGEFLLPQVLRLPGYVSNALEAFRSVKYNPCHEVDVVNMGPGTPPIFDSYMTDNGHPPLPFRFMLFKEAVKGGYTRFGDKTPEQGEEK